MAATLEAPPGAVNIIGGDTPPKPPPAPTRQINVSEMTPPPIDTGPKEPPKKGSAMDRLTSDLRKKAGVETPPEPPKPPVKPGTKPATPPKTTEPGDETPPNQPATEPKAGEEPPVVADPKAATEKPGKANPWKLVDEWKGRASQLEKDLLEAKKMVLPEQDRKTFITRVEAAEKRAKELEDEIRYVNYQKHPDFIKNFQEPYEKAWAAATAELNEIPVTDPATRQTRVATAQDLMELVALPLGQARELADQLFGNFAGDVMAHRKTVKELFTKQKEELQRAREEGGQREKQQVEQSQRQMEQMTTEIRSTWEKVNAQALEDPANGHYFKPKEDDGEWNQRLSKGFELVDRAFSENPSDPRLTPEQRASAIKRHAAVRNRAASWGPLKYTVAKQAKEIEELQKELDALKGSEPTPTGEAPVGQAPEGGSATSRMMAELRKRAGR